MLWNFQSRPKFKPTTMNGNQAKLGYQLPFTRRHHHSPNFSRQSRQTRLSALGFNCLKPVTGNLNPKGWFAVVAVLRYGGTSYGGGPEAAAGAGIHKRNLRGLPLLHGIKPDRAAL